MKRLAIAFLLMLGLISAAGFVYFHISNNHRKQQAALNQAASEARIAGLRSGLPIGTPRDKVIAYLRAHPLNFYESGGTLYVQLSSSPSTVWYCSTFASYADLSFTEDSSQVSTKNILNHLTIETRGIDCL